MQTVDNCTLSRPESIFPRLKSTNVAIPKVVWVLVRGYAGDGFADPEAIFAWDFKPKTIEDFFHAEIIEECIPPILIKELIEDGCVDADSLVYYINRVTLLEKM